MSLKDLKTSVPAANAMTGLMHHYQIYLLSAIIFILATYFIRQRFCIKKH